MMKKLSVTLICTLILSTAAGQNYIERISTHICDCIDTIENMDSLLVKLDRCVDESISIFWNSDDDDQMQNFAYSDTIENTIEAVMEKFILYCPKIREYVLEEKESQYYKMSDSDDANKYYEAGNKAFNSNDFKSAEKQFLKAIKADPEFVFAYDNLGITYRSMEQYKKAVRFYAKSLEIYPEGRYAIQNQAAAYMHLKDNTQALMNYNLLINLYPDDPEGYFGTAKVYYLNQDYENALDYAFFTHKMYVSQKSNYVSDTEELISLIHDKLEEQNKLDIFNARAREFGISIDVK